MYEMFDVLVNQFEALLLKDNRYSNEYDFHDFFHNCYRYLSDVLINSNKKSITLKIILRMIGLLSIDKTNFDRSDQYSNGFANLIMFHVRKDFAILYQSVEETEWFLFKCGLATFLCIELLAHGSNSSNDNKVDLLQEIPNEIKRQEFANELFYQLQKIDHQIFGDAKWTDLFTLVDPTKIDINQLNLTNSFETLIRCITKISKVIIDYSHFEEQIPDYLDKRISCGYMQGKIISQ
jgi:hypothetical protein